jgi:DNA-binding GntR family transcriptional regulator
VADDAAHHLRKMIFDGALKPGSRVPQDLIAQQLGISRIPLREALIVLEREGFLTIELHKGAFVNHLNEQDVRDHYELYGLIFGFAVRRAMEASSGRLGPALRAVREQFEQSTDDAERSALAIRFNRVILDAAASARVNMLLRAMRSLPLGELYGLVPKVVVIQRTEMGNIIDAVEAKKPAVAAAAFARLMVNTGDLVVALLHDRGVLENAKI